MSLELDRTYEAVSTELSNPLPVIRNYTIDTFKKFLGAFKKDSDQVYEITRAADNRNIVDAKNVSGIIKEKNFKYSDAKSIVAYVPMVLKKNQQMLPYAKFMVQSANSALDISNESGCELLDVINIYIGNPSKLQDLLPDQNVNKFQLESWLDTLKKQHGEFCGGTNNPTTRPFGEVYKRMEDYHQTMAIGGDIFNIRKHIRQNLNTLSKRSDEIQTATDKLLSLMVNKPDEYKMGSVAGSRLSSMLYQFAAEVEFVGATLVNIDALITSLVDTAINIERILAKR